MSRIQCYKCKNIFDAPPYATMVLIIIDHKHRQEHTLKITLCYKCAMESYFDLTADNIDLKEAETIDPWKM